MNCKRDSEFFATWRALLDAVRSGRKEQAARLRSTLNTRWGLALRDWAAELDGPVAL